MELLPRISVDLKLRVDWPTPPANVREEIVRKGIQTTLNAKAYAMSQGVRELLEVTAPITWEEKDFNKYVREACQRAQDECDWEATVDISPGVFIRWRVNNRTEIQAGKEVMHEVEKFHPGKSWSMKRVLS